MARLRIETDCASMVTPPGQADLVSLGGHFVEIKDGEIVVDGKPTGKQAHTGVYDIELDEEYDCFPATLTIE